MTSRAQKVNEQVVNAIKRSTLRGRATTATALVEATVKQTLAERAGSYHHHRRQNATRVNRENGGPSSSDIDEGCSTDGIEQLSARSSHTALSSLTAHSLGPARFTATRVPTRFDDAALQVEPSGRSTTAATTVVGSENLTSIEVEEDLTVIENDDNDNDNNDDLMNVIASPTSLGTRRASKQQKARKTRQGIADSLTPDLSKLAGVQSAQATDAAAAAAHALLMVNSKQSPTKSRVDAGKTTTTAGQQQQQQQQPRGHKFGYDEFAQEVEDTSPTARYADSWDGNNDDW